MPAVAALLPGDRLHLHHGPIDLVIGAEGERRRAFEAAHARFATVLDELVVELPLLRAPVGWQGRAPARPMAAGCPAEPPTPPRRGCGAEARGAPPRRPPARGASAGAHAPGARAPGVGTGSGAREGAGPRRPGPEPSGPVARRMMRAARPHARGAFVTPMAAVAGAVADEVLDAMVRAAALTRAYVNDGGDIALHLAPGARFRVGVAGPGAAGLGRVEVAASDRVRGVATSGRGGRSLSLGIAHAVTALACSAAEADAAATLIANAVDLPGHPGIGRERARDLDPDSDLGARLVVTRVSPLTPAEVDRALARGARRAEAMRRDGLIKAAALFLGGRVLTVGPERLLSAEGSPAHA